MDRRPDKDPARYRPIIAPGLPVLAALLCAAAVTASADALPVAVNSGPPAPVLEVPLAAEPDTGTSSVGAPRVRAPVPAMPELGNTPEQDRPLLREIGDDHVHGTSGRSQAARDAPPPAVPTAARDAWGMVREARRLEVPDNEAVRAQRRKLMDEALWIGKILRRADPYVAHVVAALDERYLPLELALLPVIESGFRPQAISPRQAAGLWQLMPSTALEIGVRHNDWYDGRGDVVVSTRAALDYLGYLNAAFHGDWELTLAAYNAGPGRVRTARRRARARAGGPDDFWSLALPRETRDYVPRFLALVALLREESGDALDVPHVPATGDAFVEVDAGGRISLAHAAALAGVAPRALASLNAGLVQGVTPPDGPHRLLLPRAAASRFRTALARERARTLHPLPTTHEVVAGDTLGAIASRYGVDEARLRELNGLDGSLIRIGQRLNVRGDGGDGARVEHVVGGGETLSGIAHRYAVGLEDIRRSDGSALQDDLIHPGQTLLVRLPAAETG